MDDRELANRLDSIQQLLVALIKDQTELLPKVEDHKESKQQTNDKSKLKIDKRY